MTALPDREAQALGLWHVFFAFACEAASSREAGRACGSGSSQRGVVGGFYDGSCVRLAACYRNHVWSYDFVADRLANGKLIRMLTVIDESVRECLAIRVGFRLSSEDVLDVLSGLFARKDCRSVYAWTMAASLQRMP